MHVLGALDELRERRDSGTGIVRSRRVYLKENRGVALDYERVFGSCCHVLRLRDPGCGFVCALRPARLGRRGLACGQKITEVT
jgi:hypothetical protein